MPKYLISYRKTEGGGQKPEWTSFTAQNETALEAQAIRERADRRMSVLGDQIWGSDEVAWPGSAPLGAPLNPRREAPPAKATAHAVARGYPRRRPPRAGT